MPVTVSGSPIASRVGPALRALVTRALALEDARAGEIAIVFADDATLRALNRAWRKIDRATDVLSFGYDDPPPPPATSAESPTPRRARRARVRTVSGDLVISQDRWHEQAARYRVSRAHELARLVIHGSLHLAGLDHHRQVERRHMRAQEERALRSGAAAVRRLARVLDT